MNSFRTFLNYIEKKTLLQNLQGAKVSTVGGFINALDSVGSQLSQLADATGFRTGGYEDKGTGAIHDYLRKNLF